MRKQGEREERRREEVTSLQINSVSRPVHASHIPGSTTPARRLFFRGFGVVPEPLARTRAFRDLSLRDRRRAFTI